MDLLIKLLLTPVIQIALLVLCCVVANWRRSRHLTQCLGLLLTTTLLLTNKPLSDLVAKPLELAYPAFNGQPVRHIMVLGCNHADASFLPLSSRPQSCSTNRLVEAAQIWHQQPQAFIHLSGSIKDRREAHTALAQRFLIALGVSASQIRLHPDATDTETEIASVAKAVAASEPLAVVTSAMHMSRTMRWFQQHQRQPIAAPTDYQIRRDSSEPLRWQAFLPSLLALETFGYAFYEYSGLLEQSIRTGR
jgi:uncharacterized SAM-binding protein YcdF (DUF218 family)